MNTFVFIMIVILIALVTGASAMFIAKYTYELKGSAHLVVAILIGGVAGLLAGFSKMLAEDSAQSAITAMVIVGLGLILVVVSAIRSDTASFTWHFVGAIAVACIIGLYAFWLFKETGNKYAVWVPGVFAIGVVAVMVIVVMIRTALIYEDALKECIVAAAVALFVAIVLIAALPLFIKASEVKVVEKEKTVYVNVPVVASDDDTTADTDEPEEPETTIKYWGHWFNLDLQNDEDWENDYNNGPDPYDPNWGVADYYEDMIERAYQDVNLGISLMWGVDRMFHSHYLQDFYNTNPDDDYAAFREAKYYFIEHQDEYEHLMRLLDKRLSRCDLELVDAEARNQIFQDPFVELDGTPSLVAYEIEQQKYLVLRIKDKIKGEKTILDVSIRCGYQICDVDKISKTIKVGRKDDDGGGGGDVTPPPKYKKDKTKGVNPGTVDNPGPGADTNNGEGATESSAQEDNSSTDYDSPDDVQDETDELIEDTEDQDTGDDPNVPDDQDDDASQDDNGDEGGANDPTPVQPTDPSIDDDDDNDDVIPIPR